MKETIKDKVHELYWDFDLNCARTTLDCLGELVNVHISKETTNAAIGMHGAGGYRAQCGLVEGTLMFIGIYLAEKGKTDEEISKVCYEFAEKFTKEFSSLQCFDLRPNGFTKEDKPHACEKLTNDAIFYAYKFLTDLQ